MLFYHKFTDTIRFFLQFFFSLGHKLVVVIHFQNSLMCYDGTYVTVRHRKSPVTNGWTWTSQFFSHICRLTKISSRTNLLPSCQRSWPSHSRSNFTAFAITSQRLNLHVYFQCVWMSIKEDWTSNFSKIVNFLHLSFHGQTFTFFQLQLTLSRRKWTKS